MKKAVLCSVLFLLVGLLAGAGLLFATLTQGWLPNTQVTITTGRSSSSVSTVVTSSPAEGEASEDLTDHAVILSRAMEIAGYFKSEDWSSLAGCVHPEKEVAFTPYSTVSDQDLSFSAIEVSAFATDQTRYLWGYADGSGEPLELTPLDYIARFVYNADYTQAPLLAVNQVISSGNSLENVSKAYPSASFVEFYYPGLEESNEGFDWCALKLVLEPYEGNLMLVGVIHSQWTI